MIKDGEGRRSGAPLGRVVVCFVAVPDGVERLAVVGRVVIRAVVELSDRRSMIGAGGDSP